MSIEITVQSVEYWNQREVPWTLRSIKEKVRVFTTLNFRKVLVYVFTSCSYNKSHNWVVFLKNYNKCACKQKIIFSWRSSNGLHDVYAIMLGGPPSHIPLYISILTPIHVPLNPYSCPYQYSLYHMPIPILPYLQPPTHIPYPYPPIHDPSTHIPTHVFPTHIPLPISPYLCIYYAHIPYPCLPYP